MRGQASEIEILLDSFVPFEGLTVSGKNGDLGLLAIPLVRAPENPEHELAPLPCSEAKTVSGNQLRQLPALKLGAAQILIRASEHQNLHFNHLAQVLLPLVQVVWTLAQINFGDY